MGSHKCVDSQSAAQNQPHDRQAPCLSSRRPILLQQRRQSRWLSRSSYRHSRRVVCAGNQWDTGCKFVGCGSSAPEAVLTNKDLEKLVQTDDEWIATRTGIRKRHILGKDETLSDHAAQSAQQALDMAGISAEEVDLIILATSSPDDLFGSACRVSLLTCLLIMSFSAIKFGATADLQVQTILGAKNATAYDLTAACSGFVIGVISAASYIRKGLYRNIIVIGADALSRYTDWRDRCKPVSSAYQSH